MKLPTITPYLLLGGCVLLSHALAGNPDANGAKLATNNPDQEQLLERGFQFLRVLKRKNLLVDALIFEQSQLNSKYSTAITDSNDDTSTSNDKSKHTLPGPLDAENRRTTSDAEASGQTLSNSPIPHGNVTNLPTDDFTAQEIDAIKERLEHISIELDLIRSLDSILKSSFSIIRNKLDDQGTLVQDTDNTLRSIGDLKVILAKQSDFEQRMGKKYPKLKDTSTSTDNVNNQKETEHEGNIAEEMVKEMLNKVKGTADKLENNLKKDSFVEKLQTGSEIETVVKVSKQPTQQSSDSLSTPNDSESSQSSTTVTKEDIAVTLIDSKNNEYVLRKTNDPISTFEDTEFLNDLILLLIGSFVFGYSVNIFKIPPFFGYTLAGTLLGPSCFDVVKNVIQVETTAQLGLVLIMFVLGLEFSLDKLKKVWKISFASTISLLAVTIFIFLIMGLIIHNGVRETIIVACAVSLSSTAMAIKSMKKYEEDSPSGRLVIGILVMQDILLSILLAMLPVMNGNGIQIFWKTIHITGFFLAYTVISLLLYRFVIQSLYKHLKRSGNQELLLLGSLSICLIMLHLSEYFELSMEVGCFMSGVMISNISSKKETCLHVVEPIRNFFSALFFVSIGFHIHPSFLMNEVGVLFFLSATLILLKWLAMAGILVWLTRYLGYPISNSKSTNTESTLGICQGQWNHDVKKNLLVSLRLAQISEFSIVVMGRAKGMGLVGREIYYLILGVTAISLFLNMGLIKIFEQGETKSNRRNLEGQWKSSQSGTWKRKKSLSELLPVSIQRSVIVGNVEIGGGGGEYQDGIAVAHEVCRKY
ncbi:Sodium/hydrogen exchanger family-domain-containing protein [Paraphysoderma sedebokerense]|nr:Sodium/hydrogen exchanger family-domain-containing protein [Paraphysoderma sedebokerense]